MADTTDRVYRLTEFDLLKTNINPGSWYATTDTRRLYNDISETRRIVVNAVQFATEKQRLYDDIKKVYGSLYFVWESGNLYTWNNRWELIKGNPDYPEAYQYIDGNIYSVDGIADDAKGNGILGDGSVVVRDVNRVIKAQLYIDETNDNLVIASFLGGGIKILPNGNMEDTGALYLNPTSLRGKETDGIGVHYNTFFNTNGEMYVTYDEDHYDEDNNQYKTLDHKYMVWHQGNLDATPLINGWYLLKDIDLTSKNRGETHLDNSEDSGGFKATSKNQNLVAETTFATHSENQDESPILAEWTGQDTQYPLDHNVGLYIVRDKNTKDIDIYLRRNKGRPTTLEDIDDDDKIITKGEATRLMNGSIYNAVQFSSSGDSEYYTISDKNLLTILQDGLSILVMFDKDTTADHIYLTIGESSTSDGAEIVDINTNPDKKQRPLCFKVGSIYQFIRDGNKWLVTNPQQKAFYDATGYGIVRVTGESSDASSFNVISSTIVDLNTVQYTYDGKYSFIGNIATPSGFPKEESQNIGDMGMQYVLEVSSSQGRGSSINMNDNTIEQILTNINLGRKYVRYLNRVWYYRGDYVQGEIDPDTGKDIAGDNLKVRQVGTMKVFPGMTYRFRFVGLTSTSQVSFLKINSDGTFQQTNWATVSTTGIQVMMNENTEYVRMMFKYQDGISQLSPTLLYSANIIVSISGYTPWKKIYDEDIPTESERIPQEEITLLKDNWVANGDVFEQTFNKWYIDENTLVDGILDIYNQGKIEVSHTESFNYGFKVVSTSKPTQNINMTVIYTNTREVS